MFKAVIILSLAAFILSPSLALAQSDTLTITPIQATQTETDPDTDSDGTSTRELDSTRETGTDPILEEGDPDQPIITGELPNSEAPGGVNVGVGDITGDSSAQTPGVEPDEIDAKASAEVPRAVPGVEPEEIDNKMTDDGDTAMQGIEPDEIDAKMMDENSSRPRLILIANPRPQGAMSGYLKIGDIKGESQAAPSNNSNSNSNSNTNSGYGEDGTKGGNVEFEWKVEEGESAASSKKVREIVVVGSKISDKASPKLLESACKGTSATCNPNDADTPARLEDFVQRTANTLDQIKEIRVSDEMINLHGDQPFRLFGFIPLRITTTIETSLDTETFGRVKVKLPWYRVLGKTTGADQTMANLEQAIDDIEIPIEPTVEPTDLAAPGQPQPDVVPVDQISLNFSKIQAHIVGTLAKFIAQYNETDLNFITR